MGVKFKYQLSPLHKWVILSCILVLALSTLALSTNFFKFQLFKKIKADSDTATITIDANNLTGNINNEMFGGGLDATSKDSEAILFPQYRPGYDQTLKDLGLKLLRIHADSNNFYSPAKIDFTKVIGPITSRYQTGTTNANPTDYEKYYSGPDEWGQTAQNIGCELSITMPYGDGSSSYKNQFRNLVEYMNIAVTPEIEAAATAGDWQINLASPDNVHSFDSFHTAPTGYFAWLRKQANEAMGYSDPGPYNVKYWEIGNEVYGSWYWNYSNNMAKYGNSLNYYAFGYVSNAVSFSDSMKTVDPNIKIGVAIDTNNATSIGVSNWEKVISDGVISNALTYQKQGKNPPLDFVIPHYYGPYLRDSSQESVFKILNPKALTYKYPDNSAAAINSDPVANTDNVTLQPGTYKVSMQGYSAEVNDTYPLLQFRLIDDGGTGNTSTANPLTINQPGTVYPPSTSAAKLSLANTNSSNDNTYNFTSDGQQASDLATITLTKPTQAYRAELNFMNHLWFSTSGGTAISQTLSKTDDYLAQSFTSSDTSINSITLSVKNNGADGDKKLIAELYPDNGSNAPDMSSASLSSFNLASSHTLSSIGNSQSTQTFYPASSVTISNNTKYWIVCHLDQTLSAGNVVLYGYSGTAGLQVKASGASNWSDDATVKNLFFSFHGNTERVASIKNITLTRTDDEGNGASQVVMFSNKQWVEDVAESGNVFNEDITNLNNYFQTENNTLKSGDQSLSSIPDYSPGILPTEFGYIGTATKSSNYQKLYSAIHDANTYVDFIKNNLIGSAIWSIGLTPNVFLYQGSYPFFYINNIRTNSVPATDNANLYLKAPRYYLTQLIARTVGKKTVSTTIDSPQYTHTFSNGNDIPQALGGAGSGGDLNQYFWTSWPELLKTPYYQEPYLNGYTALDSNAKKLYLTVVNSSNDKNITTQINVNNFYPAKTADISTLNTADSNGMMSQNGFQTSLNTAKPAPQGHSYLEVNDASGYSTNDTIALDSNCSAHSEYFKISSVDHANNILNLTDLNGNATTVAGFGSNWSGPNNTNGPYNCDSGSYVYRITSNIKNNDSTVSVSGHTFSYSFPAHSVTLIEMNQINLSKPTLDAESIQKLSNIQNGTTITGIAEPNATVTITIHSNPITLSTTADANGNWSVTVNQAIEAGSHTLNVSSALEGIASSSSDYTFEIAQQNNNVSNNNSDTTNQSTNQNTDTSNTSQTRTSTNNSRTQSNSATVSQSGETTSDNSNSSISNTDNTGNPSSIASGNPNQNISESISDTKSTKNKNVTSLYCFIGAIIILSLIIFFLFFRKKHQPQDFIN